MILNMDTTVSQRKPLRIATFDSTLSTIPPHGAIMAASQICSVLTEGMVARGHDVTLFGVEGSQTAATLITNEMAPLPESDLFPLLSALPEDTRERERSLTQGYYDNVMLSRIYQEHARQPFDLLHIHPYQRAVHMASVTSTPHVYTMHDPVTPLRDALYRRQADLKNVHLVSISKRQAEVAPGLQWTKNIYHGLDPAAYEYSATASDHFMFAGRLVPEKGPDRAIRAAKSAGVPLKLFGTYSKRAEGYWHNECEPLLSETITYEGFAEADQLQQEYRQAKALLMPIEWEEPFGMVLIEAMACGTPVIGFPHGSLPEIVEDGKTGFVVNSVEEMADAIKKIDQIDRAACRAHVEQKFSEERMINEYEELYYQLVNPAVK
jgi:glycosyltransferase involved in cell wall biosynthesis